MGSGTTSPYMSTNPVFIHFGLPKKDGDVEFGEGTPEPQKSVSVLKALSEPNGAKMGYGIGYPEAMPQSANISWKGHDIWFADPMHNLPWGEAVLCKGKIIPANADEGTPEKLQLTPILPDKIHGVCYGMTEKDCSIQLNAGLSIAAGAGDSVKKTDADSLYLALMANAVIDTVDGNALVLTDGHEAVIHAQGPGEDDPVTEETVTGAGKASTVVAVSEAIDPTVFNLSAKGMEFVIPKSTAGYRFTVTGTLFKMPRFSRPGARTSFKDQVGSYPTALSIVDAKTGDGE